MEGTLQNIALTDVRDHVGTPPSTKLRKSIRRMGVLQPVLLSEEVEESGQIYYSIVDGNRRIAAARMIHLKTIPAVVLRNMDAIQIAQSTLALNNFRAGNYLTEFWAIRAIMRDGASRDKAQDLSGLNASSMRAREILSSLNRDIFVALPNGHILQTYATAIAKLPKADQDELAEMYLKRGRLYKQDIDEIGHRSRTPTKRFTVSSPVSSVGVGHEQAITFGESGASEEPTTYHGNVPGQYVDSSLESIAAAAIPTEATTPSVEAPIAPTLPLESITAAPVPSETTTPSFETPIVLTLPYGQQAPVTGEPAGAPLNVAPVVYNGSELSLNDQRVALHDLRSHLISAANIASSFGMDRFGFLAQASRMWDSREHEIQTRLIPPDTKTPVTTTPLAASRASRASVEW